MLTSLFMFLRGTPFIYQGQEINRNSQSGLPVLAILQVFFVDYFHFNTQKYRRRKMRSVIMKKILGKADESL